MQTPDRGAENLVTAREPGPFGRASALIRDNGFRLERRLAKRFSDVELRQLRSLQRAYQGAAGPDLLVFGDSQMFWTLHTDVDRRHLVEMIRDELGGERTFEVLVGPGYNPRIIMAYVSAIARCESRPRVVVVPISLLMSASTWLAHPVFGYEKVAAGICAAVEQGGRLPRRLDRPGHEAEDAYDRIPAPSLFGARRTLGELRLITNSKPTTKWQQVIRLRHMMDYYYAERLESDSVGVLLASELATTLVSLGLPSVAYIPPINYEVLGKALGEAAHEHVIRNAGLIESAYSDAVGGLGAVVNAAFDCPASEFMDPIHLTEVGRRRLAGQIAAVAQPLLAVDDTVEKVPAPTP